AKIKSFLSDQFYKVINRVSQTNIVPGARDFRMMTRQMVDAILSMNEYSRFSKGIFSWVGFKTKYLEYKNVERVAGTTDWSTWKLFKYAMDGIA
ncbi:glycosyltransferase, partial [Limosilactobacillus fermentum]|nr:glycosyltransferase [Limosilactobacillus fermentum]